MEFNFRTHKSRTYQNEYGKEAALFLKRMIKQDRAISADTLFGQHHISFEYKKKKTE